MVTLTRRIRARMHRLAKSVGLRRHSHDLHRITLRRFILAACLFSLLITGISSWMFYKDSRSKYDLVRPGRRDLPESFRTEDEASSLKTREDVKLEIQHLQGQLNSLDSYGNFNNDQLSDYKVLQGYLDQPILDQ